MSNVLRNNLENELLFTSEVCEELGISRQQLYYLVNTNKLIPIKRLAKEGSIFLRRDIEEFRKNAQNSPSHTILGQGSTEGSLECFRRLSDKLADVTDVYVYDTGTYGEMAMADGFYCADQPSGTNQFSVVTFPSFVLVTPYERFMFGGLTCGYGGTGPSGTMKALRELGVGEELIPYVTNSARLHFRKIGGKWELEEFLERPDYDDKDYEEKKNQILSSHWAMNHAGFIWYHDGAVVIPVFKNPMVSPIGSLLFHVKKSQDFYTPQGLIEEYADYIPNPYLFTIYEDSKAIKGGFTFYSSMTGGERIFNAVLTDRSGRQLWFSIPAVNSFAGNRIIKFFSGISEKTEFIKGDAQDIHLNYVEDEYQTQVLPKKIERANQLYAYSHMPTKDVRIKDGVFRCPVNWIELNEEDAADATGVRVIEVEHTGDVLVPHFVYYLTGSDAGNSCSDCPVTFGGNEEMDKHFEELAAQKWPKFQEFIEAQVLPVYQNGSSVAINQEEMLRAPVIGHFPVDIFTKKEIAQYEKIKETDNPGSEDAYLINLVNGAPYGAYMILDKRFERYDYSFFNGNDEPAK